MFSAAARVTASRMAVRVTRSPAFASLRQQPTVFTLRHFSAPPTFLDAAEVTDRIVSVVQNFDQVDPAKVGADTTFESLGLDSLDVVEVVMAIEDEFAIEIPDQEADKIASITEAVEYIAAHPMAK